MRYLRPLITVSTLVVGGGSYFYFFPEQELTEKQRYLRLFADSAYIQPNINANLVDLSHAIAIRCGIPKHKIDSPLREDKIKFLSNKFEDTQNLIFILVDGMGNSTLAEHLAVQSFLRRNNFTDMLNCCFPATTPVNLCALATGSFPGQHGAIGWRLKVALKDGDSEIVGQPFTLHQRRGLKCTISPEDYYLKPSVWKNMPINTVMISPFGDGPMVDLWGMETKLTFPTWKFSEGVDHAIDVIEKANLDREPTFINFYIDAVDKTQHKYGVHTEETNDIVNQVDLELKRLSERCANTTIVVVADHGHITVDKTEMNEDLKDLCDYYTIGTGGSGRFPYFDVKKGQEEIFKEKFLELYQDQFILLTPEEATEVSLMNPHGLMHPRVKNRIGTYAGVALTKSTLTDPQKSYALGGHGSVLKEEMEIPFIVINNP